MIPIIRSQEIKLDDLGNGPGLLPFKLGHARLLTHYHTFLQYIELTDIEAKISTLQDQLVHYKNLLDNDALSLYEVQIEHLSSKLMQVLEQLRTLEPNRVKRGLIDGLGSVIKGITGNLDYTDTIRYDSIIKNLEQHQGQIVSEFNSHVSLSKEWMKRHSDLFSKVVENQEKINATLLLLLKKEDYKISRMIKFAKFAQILNIITENVDDILQELLRIENTLAFIRTSSTHHSMFSIEVIKDMLAKLSLIYGKDRIIDLELRQYYDLIKPGSYFNKKKIVIVLKFPIVSKDSMTFYKLAVFPNKFMQALIPPFPFIAISTQSFLYMEAECPKFGNGYLCEMKTNQIQTKADCIQSFIQNQVLGQNCRSTTVSLSQETILGLDDR